MGQLAPACADSAVEWLYPAGALRSAWAAPACAGGRVFAERAGGTLELLLAEGARPAGSRCVRRGPGSARPSSCGPPRTATTAAAWPLSAWSCAPRAASQALGPGVDSEGCAGQGPDRGRWGVSTDGAGHAGAGALRASTSRAEGEKGRPASSLKP